MTQALLNVLYPHYLAPIPSMSVVQFVLDPEQGKLTSGYAVAKGSTLYSHPVDGAPCRFRTCYPVTLWPVQIETASLEPVDSIGVFPAALGLIRLEIRCLSGINLPANRPALFFCTAKALTYALYG